MCTVNSDIQKTIFIFALIFLYNILMIFLNYLATLLEKNQVQSCPKKLLTTPLPTRFVTMMTPPYLLKIFSMVFLLAVKQSMCTKTKQMFHDNE